MFIIITPQPERVLEKKKTNNIDNLVHYSSKDPGLDSEIDICSFDRIINEVF